jgi:hypothetical protein
MRISEEDHEQKILIRRYKTLKEIFKPIGKIVLKLIPRPFYQYRL